MRLRINTNVSSINAQRNLGTVTSRLQGNYRRLSTGLQISSSVDDAAGLAISERLKAQVRSLNQVKRNANDGMSRSQTAEGALEELSSILIRLRELAAQASNGTVSGSDKSTLEEEFSTLKSEINRIANATEFNGIKLLDGSSTQASFQVGVGTDNAVNQISVALQSVQIASLSIQNASLNGTGSTSAAIADVDHQYDLVPARQARLRPEPSHLDGVKPRQRIREHLGGQQPDPRRRVRNRGPGPQHHPATGGVVDPGPVQRPTAVGTVTATPGRVPGLQPSGLQR